MNKKENLEQNELDRRKQERAMRLMEALSGVDEALLERCGKKGKIVPYRRPLWRSTRSIAAVMCLAIVGVVSWGGYQLSNMRMGSSNSSGGKAAESVMDAEKEMELEEGAVPEDAEPEEAAAEETAGVKQNAISEGMETNRDEQRQDGEKASGQNAQTKEHEGSDTMGTDGGAPEVKEEVAGNGGNEAGTEEGKDAPADIESCPLPLQSQKLTLVQAREDVTLGAYVPSALPAGYAFEGAYRVTESGEANLTVNWLRGMDYIMLHLEKPENPPVTVDIAKTEAYDERLYEIPYGETVPKEYWETFDNPVFAAKDLTLEILESRIKSYDDQGDTDTPRGHFSVLYPDGVLVRFNVRGTTTEIWEMICSMGEKE